MNNDRFANDLQKLEHNKMCEYFIKFQKNAKLLKNYLFEPEVTTIIKIYNENKDHADKDLISVMEIINYNNISKMDQNKLKNSLLVDNDCKIFQKFREILASAISIELDNLKIDFTYQPLESDKEFDMLHNHSIGLNHWKKLNNEFIKKNQEPLINWNKCREMIDVLNNHLISTADTQINDNATPESGIAIITFDEKIVIGSPLYSDCEG